MRRSGDSGIFLDLSDLTGDPAPVSLAQFIEDNTGEEVAPMDPREVEALRALRVGESACLSIGGGAVDVVRVEAAA